MSQRFYAVIRDLHLYLGLFVSPFVVVFAVSAVFLAHAWLPTPTAAERRTAVEVAFPADFESLKGRDQLTAVHALLDGLGVHGEIMLLRQMPRDHRFVATVSVPGRETTADLRVAQRIVEITSRATGLADATVFLHKMPGPHNASLRGNTVFMTVWRWLADATVYLMMFVSVSGIYLWAVLKNERRVGLALLAAGAATFGGLLYALV